MLTGKHYLYERHPLAGTQTDFEIVPISDPGRYNSTLPTWLKDVVGRCLETEKAQRYQNAGDLAEALGIRGSLADATAAMSSTSNRDGPLVADAPEGGGPIGRGPSKVNPAPGRLRRGKTTAGRRSWRALVTGTAAVVLAVTSAMLWRTVAPHANKDAIILLPFEIQDTPLELRSALQAVARDVYDQLAENVSANIWQFDDETHAPLPSAIRTKAKLVVHGRIVCDGVHLVAHGAIESGTGHGRSSSSRVDGTPWDFWQFAERLQAAFLSDPMLRPYVGRMRGPKYLTMNPRAYALFCQADGIYHSTSTDAELHRALSMLHAAAKEDPRFTMAFVEEARINLKLYETNGDHKFLTEASDAAQRVFRREPGMEAARTVMADVFVAAGRADEAMRLLDDALPPTDSVFRWRSYGLRSLGAFKQAAASADSAVALNPLSVASYLILADCYAAQFQYGPAATAYSAALELDPNNIEALNGLGETMIRDGEFAAAIPSLQTYLRIRPDAVAYTNLGIAYFYSGQESLSLPLFEKAVNLEPDSDLCMGYLGQVYQLVGDSRAPQTFRRARELAYRRRQAAPSDASVVARLALYDAFLGHLPEAQVEADQATREDPSDKDVQYQFALVQTFVGKRDEAATVLRVLGESGYTLPFAPSNPDRKILNLIPGYLDMCTLYGRKTNRNNGAVLTNAGKSEGGSSSMLRPR
jgi:tetratricopeptide (TPR) repeat protein